MTARAFTAMVLFAAMAGCGWIAGFGLRARSAVREIPAPGLAGTANPTGIRLAGAVVPEGMGRGVENVPVLRVFGDYECPACRALDREAGDSLRALAEAGLIVLDYHHRPLSAHPRGTVAAEVAYCGAAAGHATPVHDALSASVERWATAPEPVLVMLEAVAMPGPVRSAIEACVADGRMVESVGADRRLADSLSVAAVPAVFLDAVRLEFRSYEALLTHVTRRTAGRRTVHGTGDVERRAAEGPAARSGSDPPRGRR